MDTIKHLLHFLFIFALIVFFIVVVWWGITIFAPGFSFRSMFPLVYTSTSTESSNWLPSPKNYSSNRVISENKNEVKFLAYTGEGNPEVTFLKYTGPENQNKEVVTSHTQQQSPQIQNAAIQNNLYVRNISMYQGGHVYQGLSFTGEARDSMFLNGRFPIVIVDTTGKLLSVSYAEATTNWTIPGWVKFQVKIIGAFPNKTPCTMVFEQARVQASKVVPIRVPMPVVCN